MNVELYIKGEKVTMFDLDDTIKINRKVKDYRDIENIFSDYSESFTVPGHPNNSIFKHYYDADIEGGFDARVKQSAEIFVDQELFKRGSIQLKSVKIKHNKIDSYTIQFFTELTQLIDAFGEDELSDLDLSAFDHEYSYTNVRQGLNASLFTGSIIYPLISYKRRFIFDDDPSTVVDTDEIINIANTGAGEQVGFDWKELKPAIKIIKIFEAIEQKYSLNFIGDIFIDLDFSNMYMNLVNDKEETLSLTDSEKINKTVNISGYNNIFNFRIETEITPEAGFENVEYRVKHYIDNVLIETSDFLTGTQTFTTYIPADDLNFNTSVAVEVGETFQYDITSIGKVLGDLAGVFGLYTVYTEIQTALSITPTVEINKLFQEFKVKDFIKAFVKAFNMIVIPQNETDILFQPVQDWYSDGKIIDITPYVDAQDFEIKPSEFFSGIKMGYEKNETFLSAVFKEQNQRGFGEIDKTFVDANGEDLTGNKIEINLPFEKPIFEKIATDLTYGYFVNREQEKFTPFHSIFFRRQVNSNINIKNDLGDVLEITGFYNVPVTSRNILSLATNFEIEIDEFDLQASTETFYTRYYADYVNDVFSKKRRNYILDAKLPLHILKKINLNDRLLVDNRRYVINSYQADLMNREVKLDLFNDIFPTLFGETASPYLERKSFVVDKLATEIQVKAILTKPIKSVSIDEASYSVTYSGNLIEVDVSENTTKVVRTSTGIITLEDDSILNFYITQKP